MKTIYKINPWPYLKINISAAVLITSGWTAELYHPSSGASCLLLTKSDGRYDHTLEASGLMCGRDGTRSGCVLWSSVTGTWEEYLTLDASTYYHVSWTPDPDIGTYLMGGIVQLLPPRTTLIKPNGSKEPGFDLKYYTLYV